ncbi:PilW family protein [Pyxidicoccus sp. MSG2]|uniref:PilW family protein n=1 Tax=Pyxidicoccus sp. MSG2 TaxID=2996790 RepID=UPI00226F8E95|nr:prepilin-type N-terminal cleavage/methylation domain-containing protein [Pyxidicoccus sp. MSG2]MCY1016836.1 prepilin-type N-terminal cleavage/methylation domain-containing protein [Pyxidicoccus sp. MSG2]
MTQKRQSAPRGFTLIEVLIATTISLIVLSMAVVVGVQLQHRGFMEERTVETQNAARAARDLIASSVQRAGAGAGSLPLAVGTNGAGAADLRYAVWPVTNANFTDGGFSLPTGRYANLASDVLEVWETDPGVLIPLKTCDGTSSPWQGTKLCTSVAPPNSMLGRMAAVVAPEPSSRTSVCVGVVGALDQAINPPGDRDYGLDWTPGMPGNALPGGHPCASYPASTNGTVWGAADIYLMPLTARSFRVNWTGDQPALEMDPDGFAGPQGYTVVSRDIEQIKVRMGVVNPEVAGGAVLYFPDPVAARPALDTCTHATCAPLITWDAGSPVAGNEGPGSARDELMKRVRLVEVEITARSQRMDTSGQTSDGGVDADGNLMDGFKRRHTVIRLAPRNFGYSGF